MVVAHLGGYGLTQRIHLLRYPAAQCFICQNVGMHAIVISVGAVV